MSYRIMIRGRDAAGQWEMNEWNALVALAAVSAEPETLDEWAAAVRRYQPEHGWLEQGQPLPALDELSTAEGPWCLIDLLSQTIAAGAGFELPERRATYQRNDDEQGDGFPIVWLAIPAHWMMVDEQTDWKELVASRAAAASATVPCDFRGVLYGPPLLEHIADGVLKYSGQAIPAGAEAERAETRTIHAAWMLTPRADLKDQTPRQVLLARKDDITYDLEQRSQQWSRQGFAPPSLPATTAAYRYGGFGLTEIVMYFELVRALLKTAWQRLREDQALTKEVLLQQLCQQRDTWLDAPYEDGPATSSHRQLIESERRRLPVTTDGSYFDPDCPICQAEAEGQFGPSFMFFDGHHLELEDHFAFSLAESYEEWEWQNEEYRNWAEESDQRLRQKTDEAPALHTESEATSGDQQLPTGSGQ